MWRGYGVMTRRVVRVFDCVQEEREITTMHYVKRTILPHQLRSLHDPLRVDTIAPTQQLVPGGALLLSGSQRED
jgi:hypothetical protein